jgi:hypothetical protein
MVKMKCTFVTLRELYSKQVAQEKISVANNQGLTSVPLDASNFISMKLSHSGN